MSDIAESFTIHMATPADGFAEGQVVVDDEQETEFLSFLPQTRTSPKGGC